MGSGSEHPIAHVAAASSCLISFMGAPEVILASVLGLGWVCSGRVKGTYVVHTRFTFQFVLSHVHSLICICTCCHVGLPMDSVTCFFLTCTDFFEQI
jgi:hypothetical protein